MGLVEHLRAGLSKAALAPRLRCRGEIQREREREAERERERQTESERKKERERAREREENVWELFFLVATLKAAIY